MSGRSTRDSGEDWGALLLLLLGFLLLILFGAFIFCQWLTGLLLQRVLNPLLDGALDRHEGLVVALSAGLWALIALVLTPAVVGAEVLLRAPVAEVVYLFLLVPGSGWLLGVGSWGLGADGLVVGGHRTRTTGLPTQPGVS